MVSEDKENQANGPEQITLTALDASLERGLDFLHRSQLLSGEFNIFMVKRDSPREEWTADSCPFPAALIVYSLGFCDSDKAREMTGKALQFLWGEMEEPGMWRYWTKRLSRYKTIPPDLDDIACASYVLRQHGIAFPSNLKIIFASRSWRGLFYTWITPRWPIPLCLDYWRVAIRQFRHPRLLYAYWRVTPAEPRDIDGIVNANVLFYVGESRKTRAVVDCLINIFRQGREACCDKWHQNRFTFYYAVSRNFYVGQKSFGVIRDETIQRIVESSHEDGRIGDNALETALAVCSLLNWESSPPELARAVQFLLSAQGEIGEWPTDIFYYHGPPRNYNWQSEEMTTGFCIEALAHYRKTLA